MIIPAPSDDLLATILLCTRLGLPRSSTALTPLKLNEWNDLVRAMVSSSFDRPGKLLGRAASDLRDGLNQSDEQAERIARLLERGVQAAVELERLASRGIRAMTRSDEAYPKRLRLRLRERRPPVLFYAGPSALLDLGGIAVVGSRAAGDDDQAFARRLGVLANHSGLPIVSGGARGIDQAAMAGALDSGGCAVGVLADGMERRLRDPAVRAAILDERLVLVTPFKPNAGFDVGNAMGRNRIIYCLSDAAIVVSSGAETGGTWAGATEDLKHAWVPLFVRDGDDVPDGNRRLLDRGGIPLRRADIDEASDLSQILDGGSAPDPSILERRPAALDDASPATKGEAATDQAKRPKRKSAARRKRDVTQLGLGVASASDERETA